MEEPFFFIFLTCLLPNLSARLPLSDMFNFEAKEYIPYIVASAILSTAFVPIPQFRRLRQGICITLEIFASLIFPPLFFYATQGFTKLTIVTIAFCGSLLVAFLAMWLIYIYTTHTPMAVIT